MNIKNTTDTKNESHYSLGDLLRSKLYPRDHVSLATELKHLTFNSRKTRIMSYPDRANAIEKHLAKRPYNDIRQLVNREFIRTGAWLSHQDKKSDIYFDNKVFFILTSELSTDFKALMQKVGFKSLSGKLGDIIDGTIGDELDMIDMVNKNGQWVNFGKRRLLSSYQSIANYIIRGGEHLGKVKRNGFEKKEQPWKEDSCGILLSDVQLANRYKEELEINVWSDETIVFFTANVTDAPKNLPKNFIREDFPKKGTWAFFDFFAYSYPNHRSVYAIEQLAHYLNRNYPNA